MIRILIAIALMIALPACQSYKPRPVDAGPILETAQTKTDEGVTVTAVVLGPRESEKIFGRPLAKKGIQPVWLKIENKEEIPYALLSRALDPTYFSASEAAYMNRVSSEAENERMAEDYRSLAIETVVEPGETESGFVFTRLELGTKVVAVLLFGPRQVRQFVFYIPVPGLRADHERIDFETIYAPEKFIDFEDEESFRATLEEFQCCTRNKQDTKDGDPLNLVLIGKDGAIAAALARAGWDETEAVTLSTALKTAEAFFSGRMYRYSPISPQYVFGRPQDVALQKARDTIHERNHMRLWLTPWRFQGRNVVIGQISRDIGVRLTTGTWNLHTHAIDPEVDDARNYLVQDIMAVQGLARFGYARGVGEATPDEPREILLGDPYWTDGQRAVMLFSEEPVAMDEIEFFYWDWGEGTEEFNELLQRLEQESEATPD